METKTDVVQTQADKKLQQEFNQWAEAGRGDEMENHHSDITEQTLALMDLKPADRVLDLGCGTGWASRRLARVVTAGEVVGLDVADEMLRRAEAASKDFANIPYVSGTPYTTAAAAAVCERCPWGEVAISVTADRTP